MKKILFRIIILSIAVIQSAFLLSGCATVFKGYKDSIIIENAPANLRVFTKDGIEIPVEVKKKRAYSDSTKKYEDVFFRQIHLRSNKEHLLTLKSGDKEQKVELYPVINFRWVFLDIITGGFPALFDAYTGNWNKFEVIKHGL